MIKRNWLVIFLVISLVFGFATAAFAGPPASPPGLAKKEDKKGKIFHDEDDAPWALPFMARMKAKGIVKGYEDGSFKPNSSINQTEALVMVIRMKGTATEQAAVALATKPVPINDAQKVWWAAGHINYALENDWITLNEFQPMAAAKRSWVAKLMVKALIADWATEVAKAEYQTVSFKDAREVTAADLAFVALANKKGWMLGYPNGNFMPHKPVTRAEMAALLDRGQGIVPGSNPLEAKGTVTAVDVATRKVTISLNAAATRDIVVSVDALVFVKDSPTPGTFADIKVGGKVQMILNTAGVAIVVTVENGQATAPPPATTPVTSISAINLGTNPRTIAISTTAAGSTTPVVTTYTLDANCRAYYQNVEVALTTLQVGDKVQLAMSRNLVTLITVTEKAVAQTPSGTQITANITAVVTSTTTTLTVKDADNVEFTYPLAVNATLTSGGVAITAAQLQVGLRVTITVVNSAITTLQVVTQ